MIDTHTHSTFSPDATASMAEMAAAAERIGLAGLAFTDHVEWVPEDEAYEFLAPAAYFAELTALREHYAGRLTLLAGIEVGNPHEFPAEAAAFVQAHPWDIVLGSIHWIDHQPGWYASTYRDMGGLKAAYEQYFVDLAALVEEGEFDVLAHFDVVRRDSWALFEEVLPLDPYAEQIRAILRRLIERGKGLEINTSGLRKGMATPQPDVTVLKWYRDLGGELLVFGSDAHRPEDIAQPFNRARELALAAGFTRLARYERRQVVGWIVL
ncbi:MAG: histidinol-phosphatase HisJ family protein [Anaerolineales bacterium]